VIRTIDRKRIANLLYPKRYLIDMKKETQDFFMVFLLSTREAAAILRP
jgi:hypothetical protein